MVEYTGIDWLTMTSEDRKTGEAWWALFERYKSEVTDTDGHPKEFQNRWYQGWKVGQVSWGFHKDRGWIFVASGEAANAIWEEALPARHRVTRVDLACDVLLSEVTEYAKHSFTLLQQANSNMKRNYSLIENNKGGTTLYVGSRNSAQFGRLYDKGLQSGRQDLGLSWRYEVEFKRPLADAIMQGFASAHPDKRSVAIIDTVMQWFESRGVLVPMDGDRQQMITTTVQKRVTTFDRKLAWLRTQVRPSVKELVEAGLGGKVIDALMLPVADLDDHEADTN